MNRPTDRWATHHCRPVLDVDRPLEENKLPLLMCGLGEGPMEILEASLSGVPVLRITGEVDHYTSPFLDQAIQRVLPMDGSRLLLDLTDCVYLDSGGLAVLLLVVKRVRTQGWLGVIGANANLIRLFEIVGLKTEPGFRVFSNEEDASAALVAKSS